MPLTDYAQFTDALMVDPSLTRNELRVALLLARWYRPGHGAWPSIPTICKRLSIGRSSAIEAVNAIELKGWIKVDRRRGRSQTNRYAPNLEKVHSTGPFNASEKVRSTGPFKPESAPKKVRSTGPNSKEVKNLTEKEGSRGSAPSPTRLADSGLAFAGSVIRLTDADFTRWQLNYRHIDLPAELQNRDDWLRTPQGAESRRKWRVTTSNWLRTRNLKAAEDARNRRPAKPKKSAKDVMAELLTIGD